MHSVQPRKPREEVWAVLRYDEYNGGDLDHAIKYHAITVKEIVRSQEVAEAEVERLNELNADKGSRYWCCWTRLYPPGTSAGTDTADLNASIE